MHCTRLLCMYLGIAFRRTEKRLADDGALCRSRWEAEPLVIGMGEGVPGNLVHTDLFALRRRARDAFEARGRLYREIMDGDEKRE